MKEGEEIRDLTGFGLIWSEIFWLVGERNVGGEYKRTKMTGRQQGWPLGVRDFIA